MRELRLPDHEDIVDRLAGVPGADQLRFVTLVDRVIGADLDVRIFAPGSLEPLTARLLKSLDDREPINFDRLATKLGLAGGPPRRILAEIVAALERSQDLSITKTSDAGIVVRGLAPRKSLAVRVFFQLQTVQFVPPARNMSLKIWAQNLHQLAKFQREHAKFPLWEPAWPELYDPSELNSAIEGAYESAYRSRLARIDGAIEYRDEILQRSQLLPTRGRVAKAHVLEAVPLELVTYHRCYLYPTDSVNGKQWKVLVRRYPTGSEQVVYTQFLVNRCRTHPIFLGELIERAQPIPILSKFARS
jgi:hypothetical protein